MTAQSAPQSPLVAALMGLGAAGTGRRFPIIERIRDARPDEWPHIEEALLSARPADHLADVLLAAGHPISASTIRTYRRHRRGMEQASE